MHVRFVGLKSLIEMSLSKNLVSSLNVADQYWNGKSLTMMNWRCNKIELTKLIVGVFQFTYF